MLPLCFSIGLLSLLDVVTTMMNLLVTAIAIGCLVFVVIPCSREVIDTLRKGTKQRR